MSGVGYIGSKISLISRSDIRYVGILHNINSQDSTVALEQVRSYGTEGRRNNPSEEILPSDNVFEYIVFRGSDVKDLQVFEPPAPAPAPAPQVPNDPAILGTTAPRPPGFQNYGQPPLGYPPMTPYMMPPQAYQQQAQYWPTTAFPAQQPQLPQQPVPVAEDAPKSVAKEIETVTPQKDQVAPVKAEPKSQPAVQQSLPAQNTASGSRPPAQAPTTAAKTEVTTAAVEQLAKKVSELSVTKEYPRESGVEDRRPSSNRLPGMGGHLVQQNFNRRGNRGNNNRRYPSNTTFNDNRNRVAIPQSDFDFESANAKFNKEEIVKEVVKKTHQDHKGDKEALAEAVEDNHDEEYEDEEEEVVIPPAEEFYDKSKSFFDNISCEAKERSEQGNNRFSDERRAKQYQEKRLNLETFGQTSIDSGRYRVYRGRGYRSRAGGYRGRGTGGTGGTGGYRGGFNNATFRPNNTRPQQGQ